MKARRLLLAAVASGLISAPSGAGLAQTISSGPIKIIVPAAPTTGVDIVARLLAPGLSAELSHSVVVEDYPGAGSDIGAALVAHAPPDGHTLLLGVVNYVTEPSIRRNLPFNIVTDFKPIMRLANVPLVIIAHPSFPPKSIPDLITYAKAHPPPNTVFFGSTGPNGVLALAFNLLEQRGEIKLSQIAYKGTDQMVTDVLGNHVPMGAPAVATVISLVNSGQLKALGVTSLTRSASLPNVPTVAEQGMPGYEAVAWNGFLAPAKTPDAIIDLVYKSVLKVVQTPEFGTKIKEQGMDLATMSPTEFKAYIDREIKKWAEIVKAAGVKGD